MKSTSLFPPSLWITSIILALLFFVAKEVRKSEARKIRAQQEAARAAELQRTIDDGLKRSATIRLQ